MDDDRDAALDAARLLVTQYLGQQPHIMKASGVPGELLDAIGEVSRGRPPTTSRCRVEARSRRRRAAHHRVGHARRVPRQVAEYMQAGCTCPVLYPLGADVEQMIDAFRGWSP